MPTGKTKRRAVGAKVRKRIIQFYGEYLTAPEIRAKVKEEFNVDIPINTIRTIRFINKTKIAEYQQTLMEKLNDIPVTSIYYRMQRRQQMIDQEQRKKTPNKMVIARLLRDAAEEFKTYITINLDADKLAALREKYDDWEQYAREVEYAEFTDVTPEKLSQGKE